MPKSLKHEFRSELIRQRKRGAKGGRYAAKRGSRKNALYDRITSDNSYKIHLSRANKFAEWLKSRGIKKVDQISPEIGRQYLQHDVEKGLSASTIGSDAVMINHLQIGSGRWREADRVVKTQIADAPKRSYMVGAQRYKQETSREWLHTHSSAYSEHQTEIDTIRAFGLRRHEFTGTARADHHDGFGTNSLYQDKSGNLYALVYQGKGGKARLATCRGDMRDEMLKKWGSNVQKVNSKPINLVKSKTALKAKMGANKAFYTKISSRIPSHIFRSEYANTRLKELNNRDYSKTSFQQTKHERIIDKKWRTPTGAKRVSYKLNSNGKPKWKSYTKRVNGNKSIRIGATHGKIGAYMAVSRDLGHNRLDVLNHYLR